jgi:lipopolysaccharide/colanic/teichoic acid biosynthesis glycosyltransferase
MVSGGDRIKRFLDVLCAAAALLVTCPVIAGSALAILISMGGPVIFRQKRTGRDGRLFEILKLRTMASGPGPHGKAAPDEHRLTRVGSFLRRASIDELPQFWNVLQGDMTLVGPRPLLPEYLPRYTSRQRRRHEVRPGITGWAQIHGRNELAWETKFEYDMWYVEHRSLWLDLKILGVTVKQVLRRDGISQQGHATAQEFLGTEETSTAK